MGLAFPAPLATCSEVSSVFTQEQQRWKAQNKEQKADAWRSIRRKDSLWRMPLRRHCREDFEIVLSSLVRRLFTNQREEETMVVNMAELMFHQAQASTWTWGRNHQAEDKSAGLEQNSCQQWKSSLSFLIRELTSRWWECYCLWFLVPMFVIGFCFVWLETGS